MRQHRAFAASNKILYKVHMYVLYFDINIYNSKYTHVIYISKWNEYRQPFSCFILIVDHPTFVLRLAVAIMQLISERRKFGISIDIRINLNSI